MTTAVVISGCIVAIPLIMLAMSVADEFLSRVAQIMLIICACLLLPLYALWILAGACMDKLERRRRGRMQRERSSESAWRFPDPGKYSGRASLTTWPTGSVLE
jgi:hypothetical protein